MDSHYLPAACSLVDESIDNILKAEVRGDNYILLVDLGIKGTKKYSFPLTDLEAMEEIAPKPKPTRKRRTRKKATS